MSEIWDSTKKGTSPIRGGTDLTRVGEGTQFERAKASLRVLSGSDSRLTWRRAHERTRQASLTAEPQEVADAARWRAHQLMTANAVPEALSVLEEAMARVPEADLRGVVATEHLHAADFEKA